MDCLTIDACPWIFSNKALIMCEAIFFNYFPKFIDPPLCFDIEGSHADGFQILGPLQHCLSFLLWWWHQLAIANHCQGLPSLMPRGVDFQGAELGLMVSKIRSRISLKIWTGLEWLRQDWDCDISRWESSSQPLLTSSQNRTLASWDKGCLSIWYAQWFPTFVCWVAKHSLWNLVWLDPTWVCQLATHLMKCGMFFVKKAGWCSNY